MHKIKTIGSIIFISTLLMFGCDSNNKNQRFFGYLGTAINDLGTGNYIVELSSSSNIATIAPSNDGTENVINLIIEAQNNNMKSIVWVDHLFFYIKWDTPEKELYLYPDYQERWDEYSSQIRPYTNSIYMFYILDEPYWNGSQVGISKSDMLVMLETVGSTIRTTFPNVHVGSCFGYPSLCGEFEIPKNYTLAGFDYYLQDEDVESYFSNYLNYLEQFQNKLFFPQKIFLVPGGFQYLHNQTSQESLIKVANFFNDLYLNNSIELMIVFLYPSVPGLIGLEDLPELMKTYEKIGRKIMED